MIQKPRLPDHARRSTRGWARSSTSDANEIAAAKEVASEPGIDEADAIACRGEPLRRRSVDPVSALNLARLLDQFDDCWSPRTIADVNRYEVKLVKVAGEFVWHMHDDTDELFLVLSGRLTIQLRHRDVVLDAGELFVVPRGVEHCPRADEKTAVLLLEPQGVQNTGDAGGDRTATPQRLA